MCSETISYQNITLPCLGEGMIGKKNNFSSFYVVRDDLLHPLVNGNKSRKLDALLPVLEDNAVTGVVSLCQHSVSPCQTWFRSVLVLDDNIHCQMY